MLGLICLMIGLLTLLGIFLYMARLAIFFPALASSSEMLGLFKKPPAYIEIKDNSGRNDVPRTIEANKEFPKILGLELFPLDIKTSWRVVPVLPEGITNEELNGGDIPSPYCEGNGGYNRCGW